MAARNEVILNLARLLGLGSDRQSIITSASFVIVSLFCAYTIASYLKLTIYPFENRIIYYQFFHSYIFSQSIDHLIIICATATWLAFSLERRPRFLPLLIYCAGLTILTIAIGSHPAIDIAAIFSMPFIISVLIFNR